MIELLAHMGIWDNEEEKNKLDSLKKAVEMNVGIETDIRDFNGEIVISHDVANSNSPKLIDFLEMIKYHPNFKKIIYALNIKSDGLENYLKKIIEDYELEENIIFFDMSFPTLLKFSKEFTSKNLATRTSEFEKEPLLLYDKCGWVIIASFNEEWFTEENMRKFILDGKKIIVLSSELPGRDPYKLWETLKILSKEYPENLYLCTDWITKAKEFFR